MVFKQEYREGKNENKQQILIYSKSLYIMKITLQKPTVPYKT